MPTVFEVIAIISRITSIRGGQVGGTGEAGAGEQAKENIQTQTAVLCH